MVGGKPEKLQSTCAEISEDGGQASCTQSCDMRDETPCVSLITTLVHGSRHIHGACSIICRGQSSRTTGGDQSEGFRDGSVRTNLVGGFLVAREVYQSEHEKPKPAGVFVNMLAGTLWGRHAPAWATRGACTPPAWTNFHQDSGGSTWAHAGVTVNAVAPGLGSLPAAWIPTKTAR